MARYVIFHINDIPYVVDSETNTVHRAETADQGAEHRILDHLLKGKLSYAENHEEVE